MIKSYFFSTAFIFILFSLQASSWKTRSILPTLLYKATSRQTPKNIKKTYIIPKRFKLSDSLPIHPGLKSFKLKNGLSVYALNNPK